MLKCDYKQALQMLGHVHGTQVVNSECNKQFKTNEKKKSYFLKAVTPL